MKVSVVVPILDAARTLPLCLPALASLVPPADEVLLVDNGSTDGSRELVQGFVRDHGWSAAVSLEEPRRGASAARNAGIRAARGEVVAFTDADCAPEPGWLAALIAPFGDPRVGAVAGRVVPAAPASTVELFSALYTLRSDARPARFGRWTPWAGGFPTANLAVRRPLLASVGGFDESLAIYGEDHDLCARLYGRGAEIAYAPEARVRHHHRATVRGMLRQAFGFGRSHAWLLRRRGRGLWMALPGRSFAWEGAPVTAWVEAASADKKLAALLILGAVLRPAALLVPAYLAWLALAGARRARPLGVRVSPAEALLLAGLLVAKSAALTAGRWRGSLEERIACL
jgi:GT2 family glycosyltransferase